MFFEEKELGEKVKIERGVLLKLVGQIGLNSIKFPDIIEHADFDLFPLTKDTDKYVLNVTFWVNEDILRKTKDDIRLIVKSHIEKAIVILRKQIAVCCYCKTYPEDYLVLFSINRDIVASYGNDEIVYDDSLCMETEEFHIGASSELISAPFNFFKTITKDMGL